MYPGRGTARTRRPIRPKQRQGGQVDEKWRIRQPHNPAKNSALNPFAAPAIFETQCELLILGALMALKNTRCVFCPAMALMCRGRGGLPSSSSACLPVKGAETAERQNGTSARTALLSLSREAASRAGRTAQGGSSKERGKAGWTLNIKYRPFLRRFFSLFLVFPLWCVSTLPRRQRTRPSGRKGDPDTPGSTRENPTPRAHQVSPGPSDPTSVPRVPPRAGPCSLPWWWRPPGPSLRPLLPQPVSICVGVEERRAGQGTFAGRDSTGI